MQRCDGHTGVSAGLSTRFSTEPVENRFGSQVQQGDRTDPPMSRVGREGATQQHGGKALQYNDCAMEGQRGAIQLAADSREPITVADDSVTNGPLRHFFR